SVMRAPVPGPGLRSLPGRSRIIEREFDVVEAGYLHVAQRRDRIAVRGDGELDRLAAQIRHQLPKLRMHAVLAGAEVDGTHRQAAHPQPDLFHRQTITPHPITLSTPHTPT